MVTYTTDRKVSGFKILDCKFFHDILEEQSRLEHVEAMKKDPGLAGIYGIGLGECCRECHVNDCLITVRPKADEGPEKGLVDWFLGIEALVCCELYDYACSIPHQWWLDRALEYGTTRIDERNRNHVVPFRAHHPTPNQVKKQQKKIVRAQVCNTCGVKVKGVVCDNCGAPQ